MLFLTPTLQDRHLQVIEQIGDLRRRLKFSTSDNLNRWTGFLAKMSYARLIHSSNSMEGIKASLDEAIAAVDRDEPPAQGRSADWNAVLGHREAMDYIIQLAKDASIPYNVGTILGLHFMMMKHDLANNPGRFRSGAIFVTQESTGKTVYAGPDKELVAPLMEELFSSLNEKNQEPVLVRAAMAHLNLTMIHPFRDGNGRMARALQTMALAREGILDPWFSSIEEFVGDYAGSYYDVLSQVGHGSWHPENDATPWIEFCLNAHYIQASKLLRRVAQLDAFWTKLEDLIQAEGLPARTIHALVRTAPGRPIRSAIYQAEADVSGQVAKTDFRLLVDKKLLIPRGERRARVYFPSVSLIELRAGTKIRQPLEYPFRSQSPQISEQGTIFESP
jgi:Fic family protein